MFILFVSLGLVVLFSCKKPAGEGGNSSIRGRIWVKDYPTLNEYAATDEDVYIIYGDDISYGERLRTNYEGYYEFKYLRKGKYKIYAYSMALTSLQDSAVVQEVEITDKKQTVECPQMTILK